MHTYTAGKASAVLAEYQQFIQPTSTKRALEESEENPNKNLETIHFDCIVKTRYL